jgi:hypothetical protein
MAELNLIEHLVVTTEAQYKRLVNDLNAIPAEARNVCPGGCARTALSVVAECGMINGFVARYLRGEEVKRPSPEERNAFLASFDTAEKALPYLEEQTNFLLETLRGLDPATLGDTDDALFRRPMTRFAIAELPAVHMSYHDGQLNQLHMLSGDGHVHW